MDAILAAMKKKRQADKGPAFVQPTQPQIAAAPQQLPTMAPDPSIIDPRSKKPLQILLDSPASYEIEASLGLFVANDRRDRFNFVPGVTVTQFQAILGVLKNIKGTHTQVQNDTVAIESNVNVRRITSDDNVIAWQKKIRSRDTIENHEWGYRISSSSEEILKSGPAKFTPDLFRHRKRQIFTITNENSELYGVRFDLTQIREERSSGAQGGAQARASIKYEVEVERLSAEKVSVETFGKAIGLMVKASQNALGQPNELMTLGERFRAVGTHNSLFAFDESFKRGHTPGPFQLFQGYWNKPENIKIDDMINPQFMKNINATVKLNGVRRFIFIGNDATYSYSPPGDVWKKGPGSNELQGTLLDAEEYSSPAKDEKEPTTFYVFDILFFRGKDVRQERFPQRLKMVSQAVAGCKLFSSKIVVKKFYTGSFYDVARKAFDEANTLISEGESLDGLIFQPDIWYKNPYTRKWKPEKDMTIDFRLAATGEEEDQYHLLTEDSAKMLIFPGSNHNPLPKEQAVLTIPGGVNDGVRVEGIVVEVRWDRENSTFEIVRNREDRGGYPNSLRTAASVWDDIMHPLTRHTIEGDTLETMRRFHNVVKTSFLQKYFSNADALMDWGSGRGGDLGKWEKAKIKKVYVVEPDAGNLEILEARLKSMKNKPKEIIVARGPKGDLLGGQDTANLAKIVGNVRLDGITSFFSLTFFGRDPKYYQGMIDSLDTLLRHPGQKLVGIVMDGERVAKALDDADGEVAVTAFEMSKLTDFEKDSVEKGKNEISIRITDPDSMVDQHEWLFYFGLFEKELAKRGFKILEQGYLDGSANVELGARGKKGKNQLRARDIFEVLPKGGQLFSSLNRYFVFERATVKSVVPLKSSPEPTDEIHLIEIARDSSSFIHAVVRAFDRTYLDKSESDRRKFVKKVRQMLGRKLTRDVYDGLCSGCVAKSQLRGTVVELYGSDPKLSEDDLDAANDIAFLEFKLGIVDDSENLDGQKIAGIAENLIGINIIVLGPDRKILHTSKSLKPHRKTIVVICTDEENLAYALVSRKVNDEVFTVFSASDPFVKSLV